MRKGARTRAPFFLRILSIFFVLNFGVTEHGCYFRRQVKELRLKTDAPMMECKKALTEADGDMAKAEEILRVKLGNKATKLPAAVTAEASWWSTSPTTRSSVRSSK